MTPSPAAANPLLASWRTPHETPPFDAIEPGHYLPALEAACAAHDAEIAAIAGDAASPTFDNVIIAMERAGKTLQRVSAVFWGLVSAHSNPELLAIEGEFGLRLTRHWNAIHLNGALFARIKALYDSRAKLGLSEEQGRLLERAYLNFHRAGAGLDEASKAQLAQISERLSQLGTQFSQNVLADERDWMMTLSRQDEAGLPDHFIASARADAQSRGIGVRAW